MTTLARIANELDSLLDTARTPDYPQAINGIQVETEAEIVKVAGAVDLRERTIRLACDAGANLLIVHHGLFWGGLQPLRGPYYRRIHSLFTSSMGLYSSHLPLDAHPVIGNSVLLARELGLTPSAGFARYESIDCGVRGDDDIPTSELLARAGAMAQRWGGSARCSPSEAGRTTKRWAVCTGAGASADTLREAVEMNIDTLIVGEGPHWTAVDADEMGIVVIYAGHYATETFGVRALLEHVARTFDLPTVFIDVPTGL
ncbi:MAG: Nif3-like dinuclear metal center hexameric protein [Gemmatimonadaceae bacterium]|nr:Nif3-like dinuclear metal center hexameric protein [Gemmatimonadaceae bacterium]